MDEGIRKHSIILMCPTPPPYMGPSVATEIILRSRFMREFNVIHIDTSDRRPLNRLGKIDIVNICLALKHYLLLLVKLILCNVDLVYVPISQTTIGFLRDIPFVFLSKLFRKKVILHLRGGAFRAFYESSSRWMRRVVRKTLGAIDRIIILGNALKSAFDGLVSPEKISVVPNGLDIRFNQRGPHDSKEESVNIAFLSNVGREKGIWELLRSVRKISHHHENVKCTVAGSWIDERERVACEEFVMEKQIDKYVDFAGSVSHHEKIAILRDADIFVFPSHMEGHPWVILEAMAAGLPIISTDVGAIGESVIDGENGYLVPARDADQVAEKTIHLIENPLERARMGQKSRELYEANFTEAHFVQGMIDAINLTLDGQ